ncbi:MAG: hypothetical protein AAGI36_11015 [Pseudomonadota bacterium]
MSLEKYRYRINALAIISSSAFAGATLFIGLSMGTYWMDLAPLDFLTAFTPQFESFLFTIMPLFLLTLMGLILSARLDWKDPDVKRSWQIAIGFYVLTSLITLGFHMPENLRLLAGEYSAEQADAARTYWLAGHVPRVIVSFGIPLFAFRAVQKQANKSAAERGRRHRHLPKIAEEADSGAA